jgi:hypothetical protein
MSPFSQLVKLAGKMPELKPSPNDEARRIKREYDRAQKREWRKKNGRH